MALTDRLDQESRLDPVVSAGQRAARLIRPGRIRDALHGVWLGHPLHPLLAQAALGDLSGGCLTCPWHGSAFRLDDGSVARGPATAPQPAFRVREVGGALQVMLPRAG